MFLCTCGITRGRGESDDEYQRTLDAQRVFMGHFDRRADALAAAALRGHPELLKLNLWNDLGDPVGIAALKNGCSATAMTFFDMGGDPNARDHLDRTFLHVAHSVYTNASEFQRIDAIVELALTKGANIQARDAFDLTPLMHGMINGAPNYALDRLVRHGAFVTSDDKRDRAILVISATHRGPRVLEWFFDAGGDPFLEFTLNAPDMARIVERRRARLGVLALLGAPAGALKEMMAFGTGVAARLVEMF